MRAVFLYDLYKKKGVIQLMESMFQIFKEGLKKIDIIFFASLIFCLFITFVSIPKGIIDSEIITTLFPTNLVSNIVFKDVIIFVGSFNGFLWLCFLFMIFLSEKIDRINIDTIFKLRTISDYLDGLVFLVMEYVYVYFHIYGSMIDFIKYIGSFDGFSLFGIGVGLPMSMLCLMIGNSVITLYEAD